MLGCRRENKGERERESPVSEMERPVQSRIDHPHQKPSKRLASLMNEQMMENIRIELRMTMMILLPTPDIIK